LNCGILLTRPTGMEYRLLVALTSGEDSLWLEGSTPVRAYKKELRAAPFLFSAMFAHPWITCFDQRPISRKWQTPERWKVAVGKLTR